MKPKNYKYLIYDILNDIILDTTAHAVGMPNYEGDGIACGIGMNVIHNSEHLINHLKNTRHFINEKQLSFIFKSIIELREDTFSRDCVRCKRASEILKEHINVIRDWKGGNYGNFKR